MNGMETRACAGIEIRRTSGGPSRLVGYAAVFNARSLELPPGFVEIIRSGAFTRTLRERTTRQADVFAFVDHDPGRPIGRRSAGSLVVEEDARGLRVEITPIDTREGLDLVKNVEAGILDAMSFGFSLPDRDTSQKWNTRERPPTRELLDVELHEVSVVAMPAYPDTSIAARALAGLRGRSVAELEVRQAVRAATWR